MSDSTIRCRGPVVAAINRALIATVLLALVAACSSKENTELDDSASPRPEIGNQQKLPLDRPPSRPDGKPPIVLISIDTLRSDRLPAYGYEAVDTPNIDRLRLDSILFEHVYSSCPLTLPSHSSLLTGLLPPEHGVRDNTGYRLDVSELAYLPRHLQQRGYATGAAISTYVLRATTGLSSGFDFYEDGVKFRSHSILGDVQRPGIDTLDSARFWLSSVAARPFFFFFHIYEPHTPHTPPEPFASRYESPYDGEVALSDAIVGKLLAELRSLGVYDNSLIILTSDHGEGLNDHEDYEHGLLLYREAIQVPLIIKLPDSRGAGSTVSRPAQLIDIFPTILDLIGNNDSISLPGRSLVRSDEHASEQERSIYAETHFPTLHFGWSDLRSLIDYPYHYIEGPDPELFNLETDPLEQKNILRDQRRIFGKLKQELEGYDVAFVAPLEVDPETQDKLAALGYLGRVGGIAEGPLPDPKSQLLVLEALKLAVDDFSNGRFLKAIDGFEQVLAEQPRLVDAWEHLGQSLMALGRINEALKAFETGFEVSGGSPHFATEIAGALLKLNRLEEALQFAEIAADAHELSHDLLAQIAIRQGDLAAAEKYVERAVATRGTRIAPLITNAELSFLQNKLEEVIRLTLEIEEMAGQKTEVQQLQGLFFLRGSAYVRLGQGERGVDAFRREIELFPTEITAYSRLAILHNILGRPEDARRTLEDLVAANPIPPAYAEAVTTLKSISMDRQASAVLRDALQRWPADPQLIALASQG